MAKTPKTAPVPRTRDTPSGDWESIKQCGTDSRFAQAVFAAANLFLGRRRNVPMAEFLQAVEDAEWAWRRGHKIGAPNE